MTNVQIEIVPCLNDNYAYLVQDNATGKVAIVDAPEAAPVINRLEQLGWTPDFLWITHHHDDHIDGVAGLRQKYAFVKVIGAAQDTHRLPALDQALDNNASFTLGTQEVNVIDVPGHTCGQIAFYMPGAEAVFTADSLFVLGCGRLFEGTPQDMYNSLQKLAALPPATRVYCGHEYTLASAEFALHVDPDNIALHTCIEKFKAKRAQGVPTIPSTIAQERETNPFLRTDRSEIRNAVGLASTAQAPEVFAKLRQLKDKF